MRHFASGLGVALLGWILAGCATPRDAGGTVTMPGTRTTVGAREELATAPTLDSGIGLVRPVAGDLEKLGLDPVGELPSLVVLAHASSTEAAPVLALAALGGEPALVLTTEKPSPGAMGGGALSAPITYAWRIHGAAPRLFLARRTSALAMGSSPAPETGPARAPFVGSTTSAKGPGVLLVLADDGGTVANAFSIHERRPPEGIPAPSLLALVRGTADGRKARSLGARTIAGGVRLRLALPLEKGLPVWGPRQGDLALVAAPLGDEEEGEWLLELD